MDTKKLKTRRNVAKRERDAFQPLMDEAYQYGIPFRKSTARTGKGEKRVDQVFDHTAIDSAFRFAGKIQQDLWPAGEENFELEPGPLVRDAGERDRLTKVLADISKICQAFFDDGDWDNCFHEMALDLAAGTGAILMNPSEDSGTLWEPVSAPIEELLLECGPNNKISGIFWDRKMSVRELFATWPEGRFGTDLKKLEADKPEQEIKVFCDTIWDRGGKRWQMIIWSDRQDDIIFESKSRTCPWLTPRYFRVPGETYGRGVLMLAMPTIKTVNTVARLQLQAAAIAMLGIYTAVDDGVFNPDLAPTEPGVFWKVARNGGALGPSVARFPDPRLDLSSMVMKDMQMGVKSTMMDQSLPPDGAAVRSATEILERVKRLASDHLGAYGRLVKEVVVPAVKRVIELAYNKGLLSSEIDIDQLLVRVRVKSPIALAREATKIQRIVQWLEIVVSMAGAVGQPGVARYVAKIEEALTDIGRRLGVDEAFIVSVDEREKLKQQDQEQALALAAAGAAGAAA